MTCYEADDNENVIACAKEGTLPQDPNLLATVWETTLSFFPTVEPEDRLKFIVIYQPVKDFEKRLYKRMPQFKDMPGNFYVHAHTYFDKDVFAIVIECPTPMSVGTMIHELLHHVFVQINEEGVLDHAILERCANLILESPRFKEALRENH
jgi:hypothetical protein